MRPCTSLKNPIIASTLSSFLVIFQIFAPTFAPKRPRKITFLDFKTGEKLFLRQKFRGFFYARYFVHFTVSSSNSWSLGAMAMGKVHVTQKSKFLLIIARDIWQPTAGLRGEYFGQCNGQKFTTYGTLNFFVSGPILKLFFSAESLDQRGHVTKYSPLAGMSSMSSGFSSYNQTEVNPHGRLNRRPLLLLPILLPLKKLAKTNGV